MGQRHGPYKQVLNACGSTVSSELVQWASELFTAPKRRYIKLISVSSVHVLLFNGGHVCSRL